MHTLTTPTTHPTQPPEPTPPEPHDPGRCAVTLRVNGRSVPYDGDPQLSLLRFLRETLGLMGTKNGCEQGHCGACMVVVDGKAQRACLLRMGRLAGADVETIENLSKDGALHPIQQAFVDEGAIQCGFCTPGMVMSVKALLDRVPEPDEAQIKEALRFNICRCTGYGSILRAVRRAVSYRKETPQRTAPSDGWVGEAVPKIDARAKVTGRPVFADDYTAPGMLIGKLKFSEYSRARIVSVDTEKAAAAPGVALVLTAKDIPGRNRFGLFEPEQPVLAGEEVKYLGEMVAVVFAETREQAEHARDLIKVSYERLEPLLSPRDALREDVPKLHDWRESNVAHVVRVRKGDVDKAFAQADVIVEGRYTTPAVEHAYLEPEACLAVPSPDGCVTVYTGNQGSFAFQDMIAKSLDIPPERVRVVYTPCGGGFGGKEEPVMQIHAALAALRTGRPVKMTLTREESIRVSTKRHPMEVRMKHGATNDGKIVAVQSEVLADGGAYLSMTRPVVFRSAVICTGPYEVENVRADSFGIYTDHNPSGAFRGFGSTQATFAAEVQMDKIARALNMDPIGLRRRNALTPGKKTCTGQLLTGGVGYLGTLECVASRFEQMKKEVLAAPRPKHRRVGFGFASAYKNVGIGTGLDNADSAFADVEITPEGRVAVRIGATDMGQGCDTIMAQIAATELHIPYALFDVKACDTETCPDGGMTTASRQTYVTGNAVKKAAAQMREKLEPFLPETETISAEALRSAFCTAAARGEQLSVRARYTPPKTLPHRVSAEHIDGNDDRVGIHYAYCFVSVGAAVEVDTRTGAVKVLHVLAAQDVGRALNPQNVIGQIEGAVAMGMGFGMSEGFYETETQILTDTYKKLHVPSILDMPEVEAHYVEVGDPGGPFGAKGMGEVGLNPMAPALSNAIFDAVGVRLQDLPMTKDKVLAALGDAEKNAPAADGKDRR